MTGHRSEIVGEILRDAAGADAEHPRFAPKALAAPAPAAPILPPQPPATSPFGVSGQIEGSMDAIRIGDLIGADIVEATSTFFNLWGAPGRPSAALEGTSFVYDANDQLAGGVATGIFYSLGSGFPPIVAAHVTGFSIPATTIALWVLTNATEQALTTLFAGHDYLQGEQTDDLIRAYGGNDVVLGHGGADSLFGGNGDDVIYAFAPPGMTGAEGTSGGYLRGEEGSDYIVGGQFFDDVHGNMGDDTCAGGGGGDWVVGGKDDDLLFGDGSPGLAGDDVVLGNLGNDSCIGGAGGDVVRGGQGDDLVWGEAGDDWVSGDRGSDTLTGGSGADNFHVFDGSGVDQVTDFSVAEGDQVWLLPGTQWSAAQVGADTVVTVTGVEGGQLVLVGVQMSTLPDGWIFGA